MERITLASVQALAALGQKMVLIERKLYAAGGSTRNENDAEHSFQLALLALGLIQTYSLPLDIGLVLQLCLVHDLVEIYAGDMPLHHATDEQRAQKQQREEFARQQLIAEFPEWKELGDLIHLYELRQAPEARFVNGLDKLMPVLNIQADNGRSWRDYGVTMEMIHKQKTPQIEKVPEFMPLWQELLAELENTTDITATATI